MSENRRTARVRALLALLIVLSLAGVLTGCGGSSGDTIGSRAPASILAASRAAAASASAVHILSTTAQGTLSLTTDQQLSSDGGRARLSFLGLEYEAIRIANTLYLKGNAALYRRLFRGRGLHVPQGTWLDGAADTGKLARYAGLTKLASRLALLLRNTGPLTKGTSTTINGQKAIELRETAKLFTGSLAIATTGKAYPIQIVKRGRETGQTTFSDWNQSVALTAPTNVIELTKLEHEGR